MPLNMIGLKKQYNVIIREWLQVGKESFALFLFFLALVHFPYLKESRYLLSETWNDFSRLEIFKSHPSMKPFVCFLVSSIVVVEFDLIYSFLKRRWIKASALVITFYLLFSTDLTFPWLDGIKTFLFLVLFLIWTSILVASRLVSFRKKTHLEQLTFDDPLEDPKDDQLNRASFAENIFKIIQNLPDNNIRLALTGEWGIGKTTCLNFISHAAKDEDFPIVRFNPWKFSNKEEAWKGFLAAVDAGISEWKGRAPGPFHPFNVANRIFSIVRWKVGCYEIGKIFNDLFLSRFQPSFEITKENVSALLLKELKGKKLIVLIDDLDRSSPEIVRQVLLNIKEIIDVRGCVFICGIDTTSTENILKNLGIEAPKLYLEKIFQYCYPVPDLNPHQSDSFLDVLLSKIKPAIKNDLIKNNSELLPTNPRKLKKYLRLLSSLDGILLQRFGQEDFFWEFLYLAELAKIRFPDRVKLIIQDASFFEWLTSGFLYREDAKKDPRNERVLKIQKWKDKLRDKSFQNDDSESAFDVLMEKLQDSSLGLTQENAESYFDILTHSEYLTWKEYRQWKQNSKEQILIKLLNPHISYLTRREFLLMLLRDREQLLSQEADDWNHDNRIKFMAKALELTEECLWYIKNEKLNNLAPSLLDTGLVSEWLGLLSKWAHFKGGGDFYKQIRALEKELSLELAKHTVYAASEMLSKWNSFGESRFIESEKEFKEVVDAIKDSYKKSLAEDLLVRFEKDDGIKALWGKDLFWPEKNLLFKPNLYFYNDENMKKLHRLAKQAKTNRVIQGNFYEFLRMLFYAVTDPNSSFEQEPAIEIIRNDELRELFWTAATFQRIHRRAIGDFLKDRRSIAIKLNKKDILPIPEWVKTAEPDLLEMFKIPDDSLAPVQV